MRKRIWIFLCALTLLFMSGCQNNTSAVIENTQMCNGNYQHYGAVAIDAYGFYNCNEDDHALTLGKTIGKQGEVLLSDLGKGVTMINPADDRIYFVLDETQICVYDRDSGKMETIYEGASHILYMRLLNDKLFYISEYKLYALNIETRESMLLCENVNSMDLYQNKIYAIVFSGFQNNAPDQECSFRISTMNLDGSDYKEICILEGAAEDISVSDYGIFYLTFGKSLMRVQNDSSEKIEGVPQTKQYCLANDRWIYFINRDMRGIMGRC